MCWEFLDRLGPQSAKPKHLKGKKNQKISFSLGPKAPNPRKSFVFFAFQMLRLSGLGAQAVQELPTHALEVLHIPSHLCGKLQYRPFRKILCTILRGGGLNSLSRKLPNHLRHRAAFFLFPSVISHITNVRMVQFTRPK